MMEQLEAAAEDEDQILALCADKPREWAETLTPTSKLKLFALTIEAQGVFHAKYQAFCERRQAHLQKLGPDVVALFSGEKQ